MVHHTPCPPCKYYIKIQDGNESMQAYKQKTVEQKHTSKLFEPLSKMIYGGTKIMKRKVEQPMQFIGGTISLKWKYMYQK